jgi:hypothetical protein
MVMLLFGLVLWKSIINKLYVDNYYDVNETSVPFTHIPRFDRDSS